MSEAKTVRVTLIKSPIGCKQNHVATVRGLGLRKIRQTVVLQNTPEVRGMINSINFMVKVG